jgi:hypothetical protein
LRARSSTVGHVWLSVTSVALAIVLKVGQLEIKTMTNEGMRLGPAERAGHGWFQGFRSVGWIACNTGARGLALTPSATAAVGTANHDAVFVSYLVYSETASSSVRAWSIWS